MKADPAPATRALIECLLRLRADRAEALGPEILSDNAWGILLHLFQAKLAGEQVCMTQLDIARPSSVNARWVAVLNELGLVTFTLNPVRRAGLWIELSANGASKMADLFRNFVPLAEPA